MHASPLDTGTLAGFLDRKLEVLRQLRQLAGRQTELIEAGDMSALMRLLASKQVLLLEMQRLEGQLDPFRAQEPDERVWATPAARERSRQVASACERLLAELMQIEKASETEMSRRRDEVSARLHDAGTAARARHAYDERHLVGGGQLDLSH